jgi:hypothetical protein
MLAWRIRTAVNRAFVGIALLALEEKLFPLTATLAAFWIEVTGHLADSLLLA